MTKDEQTTAPTPLEMAAVYAASFGLFAPGTLMAARLRAQYISLPATPLPAQNARANR